MKIKFRVNQITLFRNGMDAPTPFVTLEVNPQEMATEQRELLARHLLLSDDLLSMEVVHDPERARRSHVPVPIGGHPGEELVEAEYPSLESLCAALAKIDFQERQVFPFVLSTLSQLPTSQLHQTG